VGARIRLSSNESPFGPSPAALEVMQAALAEGHRYPDDQSTELRGTLAQYEGCAFEEVAVANGSAALLMDLIPHLCGPGDEVLAFVNSMGGTPLIELYVVYNELAKFLEGRGVRITRNLIGPYITSLEMAGCSITLLKLDDELTELWDAPVNTPALRWGA
jgi:aspartate/methionine/tyrosine aminotransferase